MNPLKQHPYLFCNGKFQVKWPDNTSSYLDANLLQEFEEEHDYHFEGNPRLEPRLVARPISDMTDNEVGKLFCDYEDAEWIYDNNYTVEISKEAFLWLLSIGVYPFDQSHFEDGTVIDANSTSIKAGDANSVSSGNITDVTNEDSI